MGHYKAAKPQVLSGISKQRQFGRLRSHHSCCMCQGQSVPHGMQCSPNCLPFPLSLCPSAPPFPSEPLPFSPALSLSSAVVPHQCYAALMRSFEASVLHCCRRVCLRVGASEYTCVSVPQSEFACAALAAAKRRISRLERQVLQLSKTVSHQVG